MIIRLVNMTYEEMLEKLGLFDLEKIEGRSENSLQIQDADRCSYPHAHLAAQVLSRQNSNLLEASQHKLKLPLMQSDTPTD